jgi:hypothetical protein
MDGIFLGHNLLLSQAFRWESLDGWDFGYQGAFYTNFSFFTMEFWLSRSLSHELFFFHDGILAIKEPFTRTFLFSRWNSGYQGAFHTNFSFFSMEFWLSRSLSHDLFFFHDGILAIKEPFTRTFSFFTMEFRLSGSLSHELFLFFTMELWLSRSLSHELFLFFYDGTLAITKPFS